MIFSYYSIIHIDSIICNRPSIEQTGRVLSKLTYITHHCLNDSPSEYHYHFGTPSPKVVAVKIRKSFSQKSPHIVTFSMHICCTLSRDSTQPIQTFRTLRAAYLPARRRPPRIDTGTSGSWHRRGRAGTRCAATAPSPGAGAGTHASTAPAPAAVRRAAPATSRRPDRCRRIRSAAQTSPDRGRSRCACGIRLSARFVRVLLGMENGIL